MDKREQSTDWQVSKTSLSERFKELYKLSEWTDCSFSVGESEVELIKCHKLVLAASSPVFEALFYGPLADFDKVIHLPDLEPETFKSLLKYIYCDTTELNGIIDAGMLLYASKKYMLPHLSRICVDHIIQHLQITNLWEALDVAESLNEEELLETCLKMMRQYSVNIWSSSQEHLSSTVLCRLLDQEATNISETELWTFVLSWAETECKLKDIDPSPENIRTVIDDAGILEKIRFLTFTKDDFLELVKPSGIISESEIEELVKGIDWVNYVVNRMYCDYCDVGVNIAGCERGCGTNVTGFDIPKGFNENMNKRMRVSAYVNHCPRKLLTKRKTWTYGGTVCTKVVSQTHVLVTGFEVFTRIPSTADFCMSRNNTGLYNERLVVKICDDEGRELSKTDYNGVAEFNASQNVKLSQPVWFLPHHKYTVKFELPAGQYPLSQLSDAASCKTAMFRFEDFTNYLEGYLDFSFISAVMFSF